MFDPEYTQALLTSVSLALLVFSSALLLRPRVPSLKHPTLPLALICLFLAWFILHFGRHQFGGYDFNLVLDLGWRQHLGQRPYLDFPTTTPPGFNLGIKLAYALFGVSWDANLYLTALFTVLTFLWLYWLFRRLAVPILPALAVSFAIECAANLLLSFWWYNNTTLTLAAIFFLSTLVCARHLLESDPLAQLPHQLLSQYSFVLSLALLALFKPNLAALTVLPGVFILLIAAGFGRGEKRCHPERSAKHAVEGPDKLHRTSRVRTTYPTIRSPFPSRQSLGTPCPIPSPSCSPPQPSRPPSSPSTTSPSPSCSRPIAE